MPCFRTFELSPSGASASSSENDSVRTRVTSVTRSEYHGDLKLDLHTVSAGRMMLF